MPDFTTASAMFLIISSLTLQPNLFQEFQPMGGVRARFAEGVALSCCATEFAASSEAKKHKIRISRWIFMQAFYQNRARIGTEKMKGQAAARPGENRFTMPDCRSRRFTATSGGGIVRGLLNLFFIATTCGFAFLLAGSHLRAQTPQAVGMFEDHADVGTVLHPGSVDYDSAKHTYTISGSGENMWLVADAFQFVWKKMSGDVTLTADISFLTNSGNPHKKAVLMFRQSLDADSVYADVALHAVGMTALQFRDEKGALTREIQSNISAPKRLRIARRGDYVYMSLAADGGEPSVAGGWLRIPLQGSFYVGIGVCSHDKDVVEKAVFSNVVLTDVSPGSVASVGKLTLYSTLETVEIDSA